MFDSYTLFDTFWSYWLFLLFKEGTLSIYPFGINIQILQFVILFFAPLYSFCTLHSYFNILDIHIIYFMNKYFISEQRIYNRKIRRRSFVCCTRQKKI